MKERALSLDALRGYAIITMVLSAQIYLNSLPAWMAHAQVPPGRGFTPDIYGITWVDLVFPFFLFAMGAAFPFSVGSKLAKGVSKLKICFDALIRGAQFVFFAIFFYHMLPHIIAKPVSTEASLLSILGFALMFPMFMHIEIPRLKGTKYAALASWSIKLLAFAAAYILMNSITYQGKSSPVFDPAFSDIILIVLANMAFFGTIIYTFTWKKPIYRLAVLPFIMAVFLASSTDGWVKELYNFSPIPWAYKFYYLKYLFIVILGSIAGEYLHQWVSARNKEHYNSVNNKINWLAASLMLISLTLIISNTGLLFARRLELNLGLTILLLISAYFVIRASKNSYSTLWMKLFKAGAYCLMLGLFLEAYEDGIRKDPSTYSYYFVTSGLAFFALTIFSIICDYFKCVKSTKFLVMAGQNPMIAYVTTSLFVVSILRLSGIFDYLDVFNEGAFMGFMRGVVITTFTVLITMFFTKIKWFWRT